MNDFPGKVVVILGAGASRGASLGERTPPLDGQFLDYAADRFARIRKRGPNQESKIAWNHFCQSLKKARLDIKDVKSWRLEQLSTFLEARARLRSLQLKAGRPRNYEQALRDLERVIAFTLIAANGAKPCPAHKSLFKLTKPNTVLTFNYDLIADQTLLELNWLEISDKLYRGAKTARIPNNSGGYYRPVPSLAPVRKVRLMKLHGSIHYGRRVAGSQYGFEGVQLPSSAVRQFKYVEVPKRPMIVPPVAAKMDIPLTGLKKLWEDALDELHDARTWIIWGYSFPDTDTISHVLFKGALERNRRPKRIHIIDPDIKVVERVQKALVKINSRHYVSVERFLLEHRALEL